MSNKTAPLLEVNNLKTSFFTHAGEVQAVRGVTFKLYKGEILGIVGESGSGKSQTCMSIMKLLQPPGKITDGEVLFQGENLALLSEKEMQSVRGDKISMVFQDPMTALNPVYTVGNQIIEVIRAHRKADKAEATKLAGEMLEAVGIPSPITRLKNYPHEFSGGMRQRAMIAMALSCSPELLIADEPTTALDVTIQAQVLDLMKDLQDKFGTAIILVTHDLGVIAESCQRVLVMYGGMIMEQASVEDLFYRPKNPYTLGLLKSVPNPKRLAKEPLIPIDGTPPDLLNPPKGCPFAPRCEYTMGVCMRDVPPLYKAGEQHYSRCWLLDKSAPFIQEIGKAVE
ncbi:MAG: ABC transporter ATP-binding protein [Oscillospiraceae bacterium]